MARGHIRKRGNKYAIVVDLGRDYKNKRKQKWFSGYDKKKDAEKDLPKILAEIEGGTYVEPSEMTFKEYMEIWLKKKSKEVAETTYLHYESYTNNHIIPELGKWKISKLKPLHLESFIESLSEKDLSEQTQHHIYRILSSAVSQGGKYGLKPSLMNDLKGPRVSKKHIEFWTEKEINRFLMALRGERYYIPIFLALTTGMRQGEILGLRWEDVDFETNTISVRQQLRKKRDGTHELTPQLKTSSSYRTINLDKRTVEELKKHRNVQLQEKMKCGEDYLDYNLVTATATGNYVLPRNANRTFYRAIDRAKVKRITFHGMRHTHATLLLKQGVHPKVVQERLGHGSIQITLDTYSHVIPGLQQAAAEKLNDIFTDEKRQNKQ